MNTKAAGRRVAMFRCHIDPMLDVKPRNAFVPKDLGMEAYINDEATGILVRKKDGSDHFVFSANIQSTRLEPENITSIESIKRNKKSEAV